LTEETELQYQERLSREVIGPLKRKRLQLVQERDRINAEIKAIDAEINKPRRKQICGLDNCGAEVGNTDFERLLHLKQVHGYTLEQRTEARLHPEKNPFKWVEIK
jgi:vacuolar-type H+-ATPase subunit D/Vma8